MPDDWPVPRPPRPGASPPPRTEPATPAPVLRDPASWRPGRVVGAWILAMLTLAAAYAAFGPDRLAAAIRDAWPFELRSDARP